MGVEEQYEDPEAIWEAAEAQEWAKRQAAQKAESRPVEQKAVEQKAVEQKAVEQKAVEQKAVEQKAVEQKAVEQKSVEQATGSAETAVCPICFAELTANREEVGALTFEGCRVEQALYHLGCITMMLCHKGSLSPKMPSRIHSASPAERGSPPAGLAGRDGDDAEQPETGTPEVQVTWGLSPMTRLRVDGFALVPPIDELEKWIQFADWKGVGSMDLLELAVMLSLSFALAQSVVEGALRPFAGTDKRIAMAEMRSGVLPRLRSTLPELKSASKLKSSKSTPEVQKVQPRAVVDMDCVADMDDVADVAGHLLLLRDMCSLKAVCRGVRKIARPLISREACLFLECRHAATCPDSARSSVRTPRDTVAAVRLLARNSDVGHVRATEVAVSLLDENEDVVLKVVPTLLPELVAHGDRHVIQAVASRLHHSSGAVRCAALDALEQLSEKGDELIIEAFVCRLGDSESSVRWRAVRALLRTAEPGSPRTLTSIYRCLVSPRVGGGSSQNQAETKRALLKVISKLAIKGDQQAIAAASAQLLDSSFAVRVAAVSAFGELAARGDDFVIETLLSSLNSSDPHMRWAALAALARVSVEGDARVVAVLCAQLEDEHSFIQQEALRTLGQIANLSHPHVVRCVACISTTRDATTRWAAVQTLGALIAGVQIRPGVRNANYDMALKVLTERLEDEEVLVRLDAARHLGHMDASAAPVNQSRLSEETSSLDHLNCQAVPPVCQCSTECETQAYPSPSEWGSAWLLQCPNDSQRVHPGGVYTLQEPPANHKWRNRVPWKVHL